MERLMKDTDLYDDDGDGYTENQGIAMMIHYWEVLSSQVHQNN